MLSSIAGAKYMAELESGKASWNSPPVVQALTTFFKDFSSNGFFELDPLGVNYNDGNSLFYSGKATMDPTGEWLLSSVASSSKFPYGYFAFPAPKGHGTFADGIGATVFINAHTKHLQDALTYMNFLTSSNFGRWQAETYDTIPAFAVSLQGLSLSPVFKQMVANSQAGNANPANIGSNIDVTTTPPLTPLCMTIRKPYSRGQRPSASGQAIGSGLRRQVLTAGNIVIQSSDPRRIAKGLVVPEVVLGGCHVEGEVHDADVAPASLSHVGKPLWGMFAEVFASRSRRAAYPPDGAAASIKRSCRPASFGYSHGSNRLPGH